MMEEHFDADNEVVYTANIEPPVGDVTQFEAASLADDGDEFESLKDKLFSILDENGKPTSNETLRQQLGLSTNRAKYWRIRNSLIEDGRVIPKPGRGGSTARVITKQVQHINPEADNSSSEKVKEDSLYAPLQGVLDSDWKESNDFNYLAVEIIANAGSKQTGGKWTRPDLVAVEVEIFRYIPSKVLSVHTFEVKTSEAIDVTAVYEAVAHRRAATHSYLLLQVKSTSEDDVNAIIPEARKHKIGVITFTEPDNYDTWDEKLKAERVEPEPSDLNEFIKTQLPEGMKTIIENRVR